MSNMRSKHYVIGFGGAKGAGKDTAAHMLAKELHKDGTPVRVIGMSDVLRDAIRILNPFIAILDSHTLSPDILGPNRSLNELLDVDGFFFQSSRDPDTKLVPYLEAENLLVRLGLTSEEAYTELKRVPLVRDFLQRLGTEVGRNLISEHVWVGVAMRRIDALSAEGHVLVTGIRFPNELDMFYQGGNAPRYTVYVSNDRVATPDAHASENSVDVEDFDFHVNNDGTLEDLETFAVPALLQTLDAVTRRVYR